MSYGILADVVVVFHFAFVLFVVLGGFFVLRWPGLAWLHVPVFLWGALIEFAGWVCPLTPLENHLRRLGGEAGYAGDFIDRYVVSALYPVGLTREMQYALGAFVLVLNLGIYGYLLARRR